MRCGDKTMAWGRFVCSALITWMMGDISTDAKLSATLARVVYVIFFVGCLFLLVDAVVESTHKDDEYRGPPLA